MNSDDYDATFTFRLDSTTKKTVELVAKLNDETVAEVLRRAIKDYLVEHQDEAAQMAKAAKRKAGK